MILLINGPFGVGKTTVANALAEQLPNAMIFDPEEVGYMLRQILHPPKIDTPDDFQFMKVWPTLVVETAKQLRLTYDRNLIVPMSLPDVAIFRTILSGFQDFDEQVYHFCLLASKETLERRIIDREGPGNGQWAIDQIDRCLASFQSDEYEMKINNEDQPIEHTINLIKNRLKYRQAS